MLRKTRLLAAAAPLSLLLVVAGCNDSKTPTPAPTPTPTPAPTPTPSPTPTPTPTTYDVTPCLMQTVPGTTRTVADLVVPDTLTLDLASPSGFPNGRGLTDPVIDITLNVIFLKLSVNGPGTLAGVPVNPPANDVPFRAAFPYLAPPQGLPTLSGTAGRNFDFRSDPVTAYVRVDRMGMPAVATALIGSSRKIAYNDANPSDDAAGTFVPDLTAQLTGLTNALADDLIGLGLTPCATPK